MKPLFDALQILQDLAEIKQTTEARVGLNRVGSSLSSGDVLKFDLDHARARDAVHLPFMASQLELQIKELGLNAIEIESAAPDRLSFLQRPDLGRKLSLKSRQELKTKADDVDVCIVIGDGLSAKAIHQNAVPFLEAFMKHARQKKWSFSPIHLAHQSRVALADEVSEFYRAKMGVIFIGERPGLSASNSMSVYMIYAPYVGSTDAQRNCISNIRPGGQSYEQAAELLIRLMERAINEQLSGVGLKDDQEDLSLEASSHFRNS